MRASPALLVLALTASASPERLIFTPTALRLRDGQMRVEGFFEGFSTANRRAVVGAGFRSLQVDLTSERLRSDTRDRWSGDLSYNILPALPDAAFGLSVGVQDVANATRDGIGPWLAFTFRLNNVGRFNAETPTDFTVGVGGGRFQGAFASLRFPFTNQVRLVAEHDSRRLAGGLEWAIRPEWRVRWVVRDRETFVGIRLTRQF